MLSVLVLSLILINVNSQSWCIWGKQGTNSGINGKYDYDSDYNNIPSYKKTIGSECSAPTFYLWSTGTVWRISETQGGATYAQCSQSDLSSCTTGTWGTGNDAVYAQSGSCPEWNCNTIETTLNFAGCAGPFNKDIGSNIWANNDNSWYWYFVPHMFMWVCYNTNEVNECPTRYFAATELGWTDLVGGQSVNKEFSYSNPTQTGNFDINCIGTGTASPTDATSSPTTRAPTITPAPTSSTTTTASPTRGGPAVCIWGRTDTVNDVPLNVGINGLYEYDGDVANKPSYKKTADASCGLSTVYLYSNAIGTEWRIGTTSGSNTYIAYCGQSDLSQCTKGQWNAVQSANADWTTEPNLYYQADSCPFWNCASISSTVDSSNCRLFDTQIGENAWSNLAGYIWSFNPSSFTWRCINSNDYDYKACSASYASAIEQGWTDLSSDSSIDLTYTFPTASTYQVTCTGTGTTTTNSPTEATGSPTSTTTTTPAPTTAPTTTTTTKTPTNDPTEPGTPPTTTTTTTSAPSMVPTPSPTIKGTAKPTSPTTPPPTDSNGNSKPTTAAPTSQGVTDWTCVRLANMDKSEYDGDWKQSGTNDDRRSYALNGNWLYFLDDTDAGNDKYWIISTVKGSNDFQGVIKGQCEEIDIKDCSGEMSIYINNIWTTDTNSYFSNCGTTTSSTTSSPTVDPNNGDNSGLGGNDNDAAGLDAKWWIIIIVCILLLFCCIIILIVCWAVLGKRKKKKKQKEDDAFGDTVQMNQQYMRPYDQTNVYQDA